MTTPAQHQRHIDDEEERASFIERQVELLLDAENGRDVSFTDFQDAAAELLADRGHEAVQLVLAVYMGKTELADKLTERLVELFAHVAERMVVERMDA